MLTLPPSLPPLPPSPFLSLSLSLPLPPPSLSLPPPLFLSPSLPLSLPPSPSSSLTPASIRSLSASFVLFIYRSNRKICVGADWVLGITFLFHARMHSCRQTSDGEQDRVTAGPPFGLPGPLHLLPRSLLQGAPTAKHFQTSFRSKSPPQTSRAAFIRSRPPLHRFVVSSSATAFWRQHTHTCTHPRAKQVHASTHAPTHPHQITTRTHLHTNLTHMPTYTCLPWMQRAFLRSYYQKQIEELFRLLDEDDDGWLCRVEMRDGLERLAVPVGSLCAGVCARTRARLRHKGSGAARAGKTKRVLGVRALERHTGRCTQSAPTHVEIERRFT